MEWLLLTFLVPYIIIIIRISVALSKIETFYPDKTPVSFISVVIACRNEERDIPVILSDIKAQDYSPDIFEVIVVDDNSSDSTFNTAREFSGIKNLKVLKNNGKGKKDAVRTGIEASAGTFIITTDADCRIGEKWLRTIASFQAEYNPEMAICPVKLKGGRGFLKRFQELEFLSLQGITAGSSAAGNPVMCNGANLAFKKETYIKYAGNLHDELVSGEDVFLLHSIKGEKGSSIMWLESEDAAATTKSSDTLISFLRQRARWISKTGAYSDMFTKVLAIVTFVTICLIIFFFVAGFIHRIFFQILLVSVFIKALPDYILLNYVTSKYGMRNLMKWFVPAQIVYPVYVLTTVILSIRHRTKW